MSKLSTLVFGILAVFTVAWFGIVGYSYLYLGRMQAAVDESTGESNPPMLSGLATAGQRVYAANGCVSCHTQQVRSGAFSNDVEKKLGPRPTVARDYMRENPAFLGNLRIGPDLTNVALRSSDPNWFHQHLYEPAVVTPGSNMPSYRYLYQNRKIVGQQSANAVIGLTGPYAPKPGYEIVPSEDARLLVAYLLSLKRDYALPEAEPLQ
jgi:cytochrome c oxidase cbb3-type subunit II